MPTSYIQVHLDEGFDLRLMRATDDEKADPLVRMTSLSLLGERRHEPARALLIAHLAHPTAGLRRCAIAALVRLGEPVDGLAALRADPDPLVVEAATVVLTR